MTDTTDRARVARRSRHEAIRAEVAEEEAEAADVEVAEKAGTLECRCTRGPAADARAAEALNLEVVQGEEDRPRMGPRAWWPTGRAA